MHRWWIYQAERFPLLAHGPLIAAFSFSAVSYSHALRDQHSATALTTSLQGSSCVVAFVVCLMFFLQLRIADEFKDFQEDARYRPYRPVPRGLVSLRELGLLFATVAIIQLCLTLWLSPWLLVLLLITWAYLAAMSKEFLLGHWLRPRPVLYMVSHMAIMPLIDLYATGCDWMIHQLWPPAGLHWFLLASFFNGMVIEIGRKIRAPDDEEIGVITYSHLWGLTRSCLIWWIMMSLTAGFMLLASYQINMLMPVAILACIMLVLNALTVWLVLSYPVKSAGKRIELASGLWTLCLYLGLGLLPLLWRLSFA